MVSGIRCVYASAAASAVWYLQKDGNRTSLFFGAALFSDRPGSSLLPSLATGRAQRFYLLSSHEDSRQTVWMKK